MSSILLRPGSQADAAIIGEIFLRARDQMTYLPRIPEADRPKLGGWITAGHEMWVIEDEARIVAFAGTSTGWLDHLYVDPGSQGAGFGSMLLEHVKGLQPGGLQLWVFQENAGARRFYERHGFQLEKLTDGSGNMERRPDALYRWQPDQR
ncbi:MAG TPA: GNAT family N-acetyltransferase [Candidatus Acidoferrum sp.]|nr:GNAT family N-acetyltransferase [Candidatus Acidoferrum sp.]